MTPPWDSSQAASGQESSPEPGSRFILVNKAEIDVFLELSSFFDDPVDVGNLISGTSAFSKTSLNIWKFTLWVKAQHEGALPPPCIVRKDPRVPHTARRGA